MPWSTCSSKSRVSTCRCRCIPYYGNQPLLLLFRFPVWWIFCNALMPMMIAAVVFRGESLLRGARRVFIVPLTWMTAAATNGLIAAPVWVALNAESSSMAWTYLAAAVSFGMGLMVCYGLSVAVGSDARQVLSRREMAVAA